MSPRTMTRGAGRSSFSLLMIFTLTRAMMVTGGHRDALAGDHITVDPPTNEFVLNGGDTWE